MSKEINKSIFKRKTYRKILVENPRWTEETLFAFSSIKEILVETKMVLEDDSILYELEVPSPVLSTGDKYYLEEKDEILVIKEAIRTDKDNILYIVEDLIIEDESIEKSLNKYKLLEIENIKLDMKKMEQLSHDNYNITQKYDELVLKVHEHNDKIIKIGRIEI